MSMENPLKKVPVSLLLIMAVPTLFMLASILYALTSSFYNLISCFADDSFYYYQIARNVVLGNGFTFDGINSTNGWHPLYMFVSILVQWVGGPGSDMAIRFQYIA